MHGTDVFEIWYYGNLMHKTLIVGTDDALSKVVAKAVSTGQEIVLTEYKKGRNITVGLSYEF